MQCLIDVIVHIINLNTKNYEEISIIAGIYYSHVMHDRL